jgi:hypothetical protein
MGEAGAKGVASQLGIILTGIAVGLGAGPTHELVKGLQNHKSMRAGDVTQDQAAGTPVAIESSRPAALAGPGAASAGDDMRMRALRDEADRIRGLDVDTRMDPAVRDSFAGLLTEQADVLERPAPRVTVDDVPRRGRAGAGVASLRFRRTD